MNGEDTPRPRKAAVVGGGVIGGGWAARFLLNGWDVALCDPDPEAERKIGEVMANARRALPGLYDRALPAEGALTFHADIANAVADADWVQESVPERLDVKHAVIETILAHAPARAVVGSSTSGFKPSELNAKGARAIVAHPFNPVYLLPLVELVGAPDQCARATEILRAIGMYPLTLRREIDAHIADRLLEALWRESLWLVKDGIATTEEIDEAIRMGFGLRWAQMGLFETYRIAGGEAGMRHFLAQFGPALAWPWTKLTNVPNLTENLVDLIADQSDAQSGHMSIRELERLRDDNLVAVMRSLKRTGSGAGGVIRAHEATLPASGGTRTRAGWADANRTGSETHDLDVASRATERWLASIGIDEAYRARGFGYRTRDLHVRRLSDAGAGDNLRTTTQVLEVRKSTLRLQHVIAREDGSAVSIVEATLVHFDLTTQTAVAPDASIAEAVLRFV